MKKLIVFLFAIISLFLFYYILLPSPQFPNPPPDAVQSNEPADVETSLRRAYFTNLNRQEVIEHYEKEFNRGFFCTPRLNYPPEEAQTLIRDQTKSTFLEELVHPLRESLFINGFEPKTEQYQVIIDGVKWKQKIIIKYVPSSIYVRLVVLTITIVSVIFMVREYKYAKNEKF